MSTAGWDYFSDDYASARGRFLSAAAKRGAELDELPLDLTGPDGSPLGIDIAWIGSRNPSHAVIHSCGLHGVEAFPGSAIQLALLDGPLAVPSDGAVVFVHVINPFGTAWLRRVNENNVDLNRNFRAAGETLSGAPEAYARLDRLLNPRTPPSRDLFYLRMAYWAIIFGLQTLSQAIAGGQYEYPAGLFFGGKQLEKGPARYQAWLAERLPSLEQGFAVDVHTGLGRWGGEMLFLRKTASNDPELAARLGRQITSDPASEGARYEVRGGYARAFDSLPSQPRMHVVTQEFGTYPSLRVLRALREENRWHHYGDGAVTHRTKLRLKEFFSPASKQWRSSIVDKGVSLAQAVLRYMFA